MHQICGLSKPNLIQAASGDTGRRVPTTKRKQDIHIIRTVNRVWDVVRYHACKFREPPRGQPTYRVYGQVTDLLITSIVTGGNETLGSWKGREHLGTASKLGAIWRRAGGLGFAADFGFLF